MSRQGAGTSVPAPLAYLGGCVGVVCGVAGVPGAARAVLRARPLRVLVGGGLSACCLLPRQISGRRAACPPARRPRRELRSACRLEARPGPAGLAAASNRSGLVVSVLSAWPCRPRGEAASLRSAPRLEACPCPPVPPAPSTPVVHGSLIGASTRRLVAWPGPAGPVAPSNRSGCLCVVRPGPASTHRHCGLAPSIPQDSHPVVTSHIPEPAPNSACNSPTTLSNPEIRLAELQRFQTLLKLHPIELHASFLRGGPRHRPRVPRPRRHTPRTPPPLPAGLHERKIAPA